MQQSQLLWILKVNFAFLLSDIIFVFILGVFLGTEVLTLVETGYFPKILLLEAGIVFLVGGLMPVFSSIMGMKARQYLFTSKEEWSEEKQKASEKKANLFIILGILMFLESVASSLINT